MRNDTVEAAAALSVLSLPYLQSEYKSRDISYEKIFFNRWSIKISCLLKTLLANVECGFVDYIF